jgi:hypothetical protein
MTTTPQEPIRTEQEEEEQEQPVSDNGGSTQHVDKTNEYARDTKG